VSTRDANWLKKYDEALAAGTTLIAIAAEKKAAFMKGPAPETTEGMTAEQVEAATQEAEMMAEEADMITEEVEILTEAEEAFENDADLDNASDDQLFADSDEEEESMEDELPFLGEADEVDDEG